MNQEIENKNCPECGRSIFGRVDKKYCSDACRNSANNRLNADSNNFVRNVNNILRKNRRILLDLNSTGETTIKLIELFKKGFDPDLHKQSYD
jgi:predicted  nucleic acid-binding Zn-ribbon protein